MPNRCVLTLKDVTDDQLEKYKENIVDDWLIIEESLQKTGNGMFMLILRTPMFRYGITEVFKEVFKEDQFQIIHLKPIEEQAA